MLPVRRSYDYLLVLFAAVVLALVLASAPDGTPASASHAGGAEAESPGYVGPVPFLRQGILGGFTFTPTPTPTFTPTPCVTPTPGLRQVNMQGIAFVPQNITIQTGTFIRWTNMDGVTHDSVSDTGVWNSGFLGPGGMFQFMFLTPGVFPYHCSIHVGMTGTVNVVPAPGCGSPTYTGTPTITPTSTRTPTRTRTPTSNASFTPTFTPTMCVTPTPGLQLVNMQANTFIPHDITIQTGTVIRWFNLEVEPHTSASDTGVWSSPIMFQNQSYDFLFTTPGVYPYHCTIHKGMKGVVNVVPAPACGAPTSTSTPNLTSTPTRTATSVPGVLVGHVEWEGRPPQPDPGQELPITLTLKMGALETNYPQTTTDPSGFFTVSVAGLPNGIYAWRVKGPHGGPGGNPGPGFLARGGFVSLTGAPATDLEMGLMRAGDANNDNLVDITDFNTLKNAFGSQLGQPAYDPTADFNADNVVDVVDFSLLRGNFGTLGTPPIGPIGVKASP